MEEKSTPEPKIEDVTGETRVAESTQPEYGVANEKGVRQMDRDVVICRDLNDVKSMFENQNIMKGIKPVDMQQKEKEDEEDQDAKNVKIFKIPENMFEEFQEVDQRNEEIFEYLAYNVVIAYLEKTCLHLDEEKEGKDVPPTWNVALEFPSTIASAGRTRLHDVANYFGLAHHSIGNKKTNRRTVLYPKTIYVKKQQAEKDRLEKEREKIREKFQDKSSFAGEPPKNPQTFREQVMRELWDEKFAPKGSQKQVHVTTNMLNLGSEIGHEPDMKVLLDKIAKKKADLEQIQENMKKKQILASEQLKRMEKITKDNKQAKEDKKVAAKESPQTLDDDDENSEGFDEEEVELDEETKAMLMEQERKKMISLEIDAQRNTEYHERLENESLKSFEDVPDDIKEVFVIKASNIEAEISWDAPDCNNSKILTYNIYVSDKVITNVGTADQQTQKSDKGSQNHTYRLFGTTGNDLSCMFKMKDLEPNTAYYVIAKAVNAKGEGYEPESPSFLMTQKDSYDRPSSLYVWGSNNNSELGIDDAFVKNNEQHFHKTKKNVFLSKPLKHDKFASMTQQIAQGNLSALALIVDHEETIIIQMGQVTMLQEKHENNETKDKNFIDRNELQMIESIPSLPFQVDFCIPVNKIQCGDGFSAIVTAEGQVFTWGFNDYGQLGINKEQVLLQLRPDSREPIKFRDEQNIMKTVKIIDIECGLKSMVALSDDNKVFVWGRRMGVYAINIELTLDEVEKKGKFFSYQEINQACPRLIKNNLVFYTPTKIVNKNCNAALITDKGELLIQGMNDTNQLLLPQELTEHLQFFPNFMKMDFFNEFKVRDVEIGACVIYAICEHKTTKRVRIFGWGSNEFGQLVHPDPYAIFKEPVDLTKHFIEEKDIGNDEDVIFDEDEIVKVKAGAYHTLVLTSANKLYGMGKLTKGQLGMKQSSKDQKQIHQPIEIPIEYDMTKEEIVDIEAETFASCALIAPKRQAPVRQKRNPALKNKGKKSESSKEEASPVSPQPMRA